MVAQARTEEANVAKRAEALTLQDTVRGTAGLVDRGTRMSPHHVLQTDKKTEIYGVGVATQRAVAIMITMSMDGVIAEGVMGVVGSKVVAGTARVGDQVSMS